MYQFFLVITQHLLLVVVMLHLEDYVPCILPIPLHLVADRVQAPEQPLAEFVLDLHCVSVELERQQQLVGLLGTVDELDTGHVLNFLGELLREQLVHRIHFSHL